ncbi:MAG: uroporphyrinogen-III synthase [Gammaproteobacteria bacterium]|nr:uroporphyrinogen-III synthase [Gammaproteobacteria bacterium]MBU1656018.1 uroporphyrinogen-III synthase [Gammaproteobacteria bacterium]MBU1962226.1 uroporphyrinogen-III synthase [Gammaproteobacteria bacterium]
MAIKADRRFGVLVTRPFAQAEGLCESIEGLGWRSIPFPTIEIAPLCDNGPWHERDFDLLIFVSKNAVIYGLPLLRGLKKSTRIAVVGRGTARQLEEMGRHADILPDGRWDSEGLLAHPGLQAVEGQRVLILRGEGGRPLLADRLRSRGALVAYAEVYRRLVPEADVTSLITTWTERVDFVLATSNEILDNLHSLLGNDATALLQRTPVVVVSERGLGHARAKGCERVILARGADDESLVAAMLQWTEGANL